jgi:hypothetical protein
VNKRGSAGFHHRCFSREKNLVERIGLAQLTGDRAGELEQANNDAALDAPYLDVVPLPDGGYRIYY